MPYSSVPQLVFPADVVLLITRLLCLRDKRALLLTCRTYSYVVSPVLYRSLSVFFPVPERDDPEYMDPPSYRLLVCLVRSMGCAARSIRPRCNPQLLVTFAYCSDSGQADLRALPLVGDVLRAAVRLRHLSIDVPAGSVPLLLDIFRRAGVVITPTVLGLEGAEPAPDRAILPSLTSIRSTRLALIDAMMRYRAIDTVVLEVSPNDIALAKFLRPTPAWNPSHLRHLFLSYAGGHWIDTLAGAIFASFPSLEHLALRVSTREAALTATVSALCYSAYSIVD